jgi:pyocin large subunit-like protein
MQKPLVYAIGALALALSACGGKPSAVPAASRTASFGVAAASAPSSYGDQRDTEVPKVAGKPMWAANRTHTAEENAQYQFTKNGRDFAASDERDYISKVHAFIDHPPGDAQSIDRSNGDRLIYDAGGNIFAVVSRDGAPRTMFKPRGGAAYWAQQKARESQRAGAGSGGGADQSQG